jgi:hypothetical protein
MTAILGILNKTAVALAADSAATLTGPRGEKIYNNAHKLFNISDYWPIGMMICNAGGLVGIPWEIIIKVYRKQLTTTGFDSLPEYAHDFTNYVQREFARQIDSTDQKLAVLTLATDLIGVEAKKAVESWQLNSPPTDIDLNSLLNAQLRNDFLPVILNEFSEAPVITRESPYLFSDFEEEYGALIRENISKWVQNGYIAGITLEDETIDSVLQIVFAYSQHEAQFDFTNSWSGIVVAGFGKDDIFPHLYSCRVGPIFGGVIRVVPEREVKISSQTPSSIEPFAQTDVIQTFWEGVDPFIVDAVIESVAGVVDNVVQHIMDVVSDERKAELHQWLANSRPDILNDLKSSIQDVAQTKNRTPMLEAIATLSKEDLADMAESLISLTALKRRATFSSESVGGPVDVAIITKGEGFIWLKRKQYFRPELNLSYISGVLNRSSRLAAQSPTDYEPLTP